MKALANRAPQTISSKVYEVRVWTMVEKVSSKAFSRTRISMFDWRNESAVSPCKMTLLVDRVDHGPGQREKNNAIAFQLERIIAPGVDPIHLLKAADDDLGRDFDQLVRASIGDAKFQAR